MGHLRTASNPGKSPLCSLSFSLSRSHSLFFFFHSLSTGLSTSFPTWHVGVWPSPWAVPPRSADPRRVVSRSRLWWWSVDQDINILEAFFFRPRPTEGTDVIGPQAARVSAATCLSQLAHPSAGDQLERKRCSHSSIFDFIQQRKGSVLSLRQFSIFTPILLK